MDRPFDGRQGETVAAPTEVCPLGQLGQAGRCQSRQALPLGPGYPVRHDIFTFGADVVQTLFDVMAERQPSSHAALISALVPRGSTAAPGA